MDVLFIGSILCADKCQSQADFSLENRTQFVLVHTVHSHTHTHPPAQKKNNPAEIGNTLLKGLGLLRVWIVLADLSGLNHQPQTPFLHRALQFNRISRPLPVLGLKVHAMKEGFAMAVEGRAK